MGQNANKDVRAMKVASLINLLARNDLATIKFIRLTLTKEEWDKLLKDGKATQEQVDYCVNDLKMFRETPVKEVVPKPGKFDATSVKEIGQKFEADLKAFIDNNKDVLTQLSAAGFDFRPQWRNAANVGTRSKKEPSLT